MERICLVYGGDSVESEISVLTALKVQTELEKFSYPYVMVYLDHEGNFYTGEGLNHKNNYPEKIRFHPGKFEKKDGCFWFKSGMKKQYFDVVMLLCHGQGAEDGTLGGYFDTLKIPCLYPGLSISALLQDKAVFKRVMQSLNVPQTKFSVLTEKEFSSSDAYLKNLSELRYPLVVKPAHLGSSIGVQKIQNAEDLVSSLMDAFRYDDCVVIEEAVCSLKEINIAILRKDGEVVSSQLERVNGEDRVLSFLDKYDNYTLGESHIIPADIDKKTVKKIVFLSKKIYQQLNIRSVVRFDYLFDQSSGEIYLNEINAIPGSLSYYLFEGLDIRLVDLIDLLLQQFRLDRIEKKKKVTHYSDGFLASLKEK